MTIGEHMRKAREKAGLTLMELSELSGVTPGSISLYERDRRTPGLYSLMSICDVLGISIDEYVGYKLKEGE